MGRLRIFSWAFLPLAALLTSCVVVDGPVSTSSGSGLAKGSIIAFAETQQSASNALQARVQNGIADELVRVGYRVGPKPDYRLEFGIAKRPAGTGVLLPGNNTARPEEGTWRSRPIDKDSFALCTGSIYRLMIVVSREQTGEIVFKGGSDDEICGTLTDEKLRSLVASSIAGLRQKSLSM